MNKLPDYDVDLRIVQKSRPIFETHFFFTFLGFEINLDLGSAVSTEFRVMDPEYKETYFIGNTLPECKNWISENVGSSPED